MFIERLNTTGFKNISDADLSFSKGFNCLTGNNGAGKTNLLDAIYMLSMCRSAFSVNDSQCVRHGEKFFSVKGYYDMDGASHNVFCNYSQGKKVLKYDGKPYSKLSDHIGLIPVVMISPKDNELIDGMSDVRRKWMDSVISQGDPVFLKDLVRYAKILLQRNTLLKKYPDPARCRKEEFEMWDVQLVSLCEKIVSRRTAFLEKFTVLFNFYYSSLSPEEEKVSIRYRNSLGTFENYEKALEETFSRDIALGYTTVGVHRDDIHLDLGGYPVKRIGSQGQKKSFLVALKLAQYSWLSGLSGRKPLLLLDDIFDKLDSSRVKNILDLVGGEAFGQIFITDTERTHIEDIVAQTGWDYKLFTVSHGEVSEWI